MLEMDVPPRYPPEETRRSSVRAVLAHSAPRLLARIAIAGLLAGLGLAIIDLVTSGNTRSGSLRTERLILSIASGMLYVTVLAPLAVRLPATGFARLVSIFVPLYVTGSVADLVEAYFFTTLLTPVSLVAALLFQAIPALAVAIIVAALVPAAPSINQKSIATPRHRSLPSWALRLLIAGVLYLPAYYGFAALVAPIEHPFYSDPAFVAQLQTRSPSDSVIVPLEVLRGMLFALAVLPVLAVVPGRGWSSLAYLTLIGVVIEAVVPLLGRTSWPVLMRLGNIVELTGDALARAVAVMALLGFPPLVNRDSWRAVMRRLGSRTV